MKIKIALKTTIFLSLLFQPVSAGRTIQDLNKIQKDRRNSIKKEEKNSLKFNATSAGKKKEVEDQEDLPQKKRSACTKRIKKETPQKSKRIKKFINGSLENAYELVSNNKKLSDEEMNQMTIQDLLEEEFYHVNENDEGDSHITFDNEGAFISSAEKKERLNLQLANLIENLKAEAKKTADNLLQLTNHCSENQNNIHECESTNALASLLENISENANEETIIMIDKIDKEITEKIETQLNNIDTQLNPEKKTFLNQIIYFKQNHPTIYHTLLALLGTIAYVAIDSQLHFTFNLGITDLSDYLSIWEFIQYLPYTSLNSIVPTAAELLKAHTLPYISFNALLNIPTLSSYVKSGYHKIKNFIRTPRFFKY